MPWKEHATTQSQKRRLPIVFRDDLARRLEGLAGAPVDPATAVLPTPVVEPGVTARGVGALLDAGRVLGVSLLLVDVPRDVGPGHVHGPAQIELDLRTNRRG